MCKLDKSLSHVEELGIGRLILGVSESGYACVEWRM